MATIAQALAFMILVVAFLLPWVVVVGGATWGVLRKRSRARRQRRPSSGG